MEKRAVGEKAVRYGVRSRLDVQGKSGYPQGLRTMKLGLYEIETLLLLQIIRDKLNKN